MSKQLFLNEKEITELENLLKKAEKETGEKEYIYDPGFATYSCSCTAHKKSCGWD